MKNRRSGLFLVGFALAGLGYLMLWPVAVDPAQWAPPVAPGMAGPYAPNNRLASIERVELTDGHGPEDVAIDGEGNLYGGLQDGRIVKLAAGTRQMTVLADTGGRPLGLHFDRNGHLIVADAYKGLLSVDADGAITVLATEADGMPFRFTDDVDIALDGTIYFSDASHKFNQAEYRLDALEHRPHGRLLAFDPRTRTTRVLLDNLYFANGVAVSPDQSFVAVNETWSYRVTRYWLAGEKRGRSEIWIDNLPGFPDGISSNGEDTFWIAVASPRNPLLDNLAGKPFLRKVIARLPRFVQPDAVPYAFVLGVDVNGQVIHNLQEPSGKPYAFITSVQQHGDTLWLGSLEEEAIGFYKLPDLPEDDKELRTQN